MSLALELVAPLLNALSNTSLPATLRSSVISILGTLVEVAPLPIAASGHAEQMGRAMLDLLALELQGVRPDGTVDHQADSATARPKDMTKAAHLRRSALHLLTLLIRGSKHQLETKQLNLPQESSLSSLRLPNGTNLPPLQSNSPPRQVQGNTDPLLFDPTNSDLASRTRNLSRYAHLLDVDPVVKAQAGELILELEHLELMYLH